MTNNNNNDSSIGTTIPLYEEVKRTIYVNFCELVNAYSDLITASNFEKKVKLWDFRKRYTVFFLQVNHINKLNKISDSKQKYLRDAFKYLEKVDINKSSKIILYSRELIEALGITKIEGRVKDPSKAILGEY